MVVRIDPRHAVDMRRIPQVFHGYPVRIEPRDSAIAAENDLT
jgi:hypothetical protein